jgi:hypothetical protein
MNGAIESIGVKRRGNTNDEAVALGASGKVGRRFKAVCAHFLDHFRFEMLNRALSRVQFIDTLAVDVKPDGLHANTGNSHRERNPNIAKSDNANDLFSRLHSNNSPQSNFMIQWQKARAMPPERGEYAVSR